MKKDETPRYARSHRRALTLMQENAAELLASGKNDTEVSTMLQLARCTVTRWRLYDVEFIAALNERRRHVWSSGTDKLRSLIPAALDALADALKSGDTPTRLKAAGEILRLAGPDAVALRIGPTEPEEIVSGIVALRRQQAHGPIDDLMNNDKGLPPWDKHVEAVRAELEARAAEPNAAPPAPPK